MGKAANIIRNLHESEDSYSTQVRSVEVYGLSSDGDVYAENGSATIHWSVYWDVRDYGIKSLDVTIRALEVEWTQITAQDDNGDQLTVTEDLSAPGKLSWKQGDETWKVEIEYDTLASGPSSFSLIPSSVDVHLQEKTLTVHF